MAFQPEDILEGGRSIRPFLPELLGNDAVQVDKQLAELLAQAKAGQQVEQQILEILKSYPDTRNWIAEFLSEQQVSKGFQQLPGSGEALSAQKYICPQGDYVWYRRVVGATIPTCPTHGVLLIPADQ
ncbi:hypothetical protein [Anabaena subtropica]|uniref:Uncharacterized protein n=1 Tax=Anabaena subtropica FACHB-260 TaxID=2692884 RepID=A0ABR8CQ29_9NOST|nr:hypothetical protein [Anabaena subtropica]MBD2344906.1 hypothetical protein [Anabaena subtropica FACHB-260]